MRRLPSNTHHPPTTHQAQFHPVQRLNTVNESTSIVGVIYMYRVIYLTVYSNSYWKYFFLNLNVLNDNVSYSFFKYLYFFLKFRIKVFHILKQNIVSVNFDAQKSNSYQAVIYNFNTIILSTFITWKYLKFSWADCI